MANKQKSSKAGRKAKKGQNLKYKNERRMEQNKLTRLQAHIKDHGVTAQVRDTVRRLQIVLGHSPSDLTVDRPNKRSAASAAFHRRPDAKAHSQRMRNVSLGIERRAA